MRSKVRITKRQIKEDKFTNFMLRTKEQFLDNWQVIAISAAVVVLVIVATVYFVNLKSAQRLEASSRLSGALAEYRRQNYQVAILELGSIADEYSGRIAGMALFYLGNAHYEIKNYDEAIATFQRFIDESHVDRLTTTSAIAGIASCYENKQEFLAAGDKYYEALDYYPESPSAPDYYLGAVRNYVMGGDKEKTEKTLAELKEKFPNTDYTHSAVRVAMRLNTQ